MAVIGTRPEAAAWLLVVTFLVTSCGDTPPAQQSAASTRPAQSSMTSDTSPDAWAAGWCQASLDYIDALETMEEDLADTDWVGIYERAEAAQLAYVGSIGELGDPSFLERKQWDQFSDLLEDLSAELAEAESEVIDSGSAGVDGSVDQHPATDVMESMWSLIGAFMLSSELDVGGVKLAGGADTPPSDAGASACLELGEQWMGTG